MSADRRYVYAPLGEVRNRTIRRYAKSERSNNNGNGRQDWAHEFVTRPPELSDGKISRTLVEPKTDMKFRYCMSEAMQLGLVHCVSRAIEESEITKNMKAIGVFRRMPASVLFGTREKCLFEHLSGRIC